MRIALLQRLRTDGCMFFHLVEFFRRQLARLKQYAIGDSNFSDIVQQAGLLYIDDKLVIDSAAVFFVLGECLGNQMAGFGKTFEVPAGVVVP